MRHQTSSPFKASGCTGTNASKSSCKTCVLHPKIPCLVEAKSLGHPLGPVELPVVVHVVVVAVTVTTVAAVAGILAGSLTLARCLCVCACACVRVEGRLESDRVSSRVERAMHRLFLVFFGFFVAGAIVAHAHTHTHTLCTHWEGRVVMCDLYHDAHVPAELAWRRHPRAAMPPVGYAMLFDDRPRPRLLLLLALLSRFLLLN